MRAPDFWRRRGFLSTLLLPLARAYGAVAEARFAAKTPARAGVPVLCVGNLVAGGAGKTPIALDLAARLIRRGVAVHFLSRGYGGSTPGPHRVDTQRDDADRVGDEAPLLAAVAPTWVGGDRGASARAAVASGAEALIMDDGLQNPGLAKDVSILVVDGAQGFGNGRLLPAGPLREPVSSGLARVQTLVILGDDATGVRDVVSGPRILAASVEPGPEKERLAGRPVIAFAGIGMPEKFFETLRLIGCEVRTTHAFADHHVFTAREFKRLKEEADDAGAVLVTTAKDALRLPPDHGVEVLTIRIRWEDETAIDDILDGLVDDGR